MFAGTNLKSLFTGSAFARERKETRRLWDETEAQWRRSPLAHQTARELSIDIIREAMREAERVPRLPVLVASGMAVESFLLAEAIGELEPNWPLIESDVGVGVEFRQMLSRRRRWALDFPGTSSAFRRIVLNSLIRFFELLPEACFREADETADDAFDVPLIDLIENPDRAVEHLFLLPYDDDSFRLDLFRDLRELCAGNLLVASGFPRSHHPQQHAAKLVLPSSARGKSGAELAELYLGGSPLKDITELSIEFAIPDELRFEHCHIIGGTGHGKTQLLQKLIHADLVASIRDGRSVIVIDSQGDLIHKLTHLALFSPEGPGDLAERLILIDPSDVEHPAALNLFDAHLDRMQGYALADRERVLNGVVELYELFFGAFLGAELTQKQGVIFKYLARLMLAVPGATIHTLMQIMENGDPFKPYMAKLDASARHFFENEFFHPSFAPTRKQVLRRLWGVLATPAFERMLGQPTNKLDLFSAMNEGKIVLVSTAKDILKKEGSAVLGRFVLAMLSQATQERATIPEAGRRPVFVYVDEAQEYFDESIETLLTQARKYRVGLTLAHQTLDQLSPRLRSVLLANTSLKCVGGVSVRDAAALADELHTTTEFITGMRRRGARSEFALWAKNLVPRAIRLSVPLGFLERQDQSTSDAYEALLAGNRSRHCGTWNGAPLALPSVAAEPIETDGGSDPPSLTEPTLTWPGARARAAAPPPAQLVDRESPLAQPPPISPGKGGAKHRYLQSLIKGLAEEQGLKASLEAALVTGDGQVDVLIERDGVLAAIEISVTTTLDQEKENLRKCLASGYPRIAVVLVKARNVAASFGASLLETVPTEKRGIVFVLSPEELPDFIASLAPEPIPSETIVKGYRVKRSFGSTSPEDAAARRNALTKLIVRSLATQQG